MKFDATLIPDNLNKIPELAQKIEALGFDGIWVPETAHNPFLPLSLAASQTSRVELGTAIAVAFPRSPMVTAQITWDIAAQSDSRMILGLGTQVKAHIKRRFSTEWGSPGSRLKDYILALKAIWNTFQNNEPLNHQGDFYSHTLITPFFQPSPLKKFDIPVYIAGVNQYLCQLAGELCDGFHVHPFHTAKYLSEFVIPNVETGAAKTGRSRDDVALTCAIFVVTGNTQEEIENDKVAVKTQIAFYASTPSYRTVLEHHGLEDLQVELSKMAREGKWMSMHELINDEMLEEFAVVAPHDELPHKVKERYTGLLDRVGYYMPYVPEERDDMWQASVDVLVG